MLARRSTAIWEGDLNEGDGTINLGSGSFSGAYSFASRFREGRKGTNPEELIAAAHAGCFSMALAHALSESGHSPSRVTTTATVHLDKVGSDFQISEVKLETEVEAGEIDEQQFQALASQAKQNCPVSKLIEGGANILLHAQLMSHRPV